MKKIFAAVAITVTASSAFASDSCSPADLQKKSMELNTQLQALAAKDPQKMQQLTVKMQTQATAAQTSGDMGQLCKLYDELLADIQG